MSRRFILASTLVGAFVFALAAPAAAHVTIAPTSADKGGNDQEITFRVPNEEAKASTTKLQVSIPISPPLLGVLAQPVPGWTATVLTTHLAKAIQTDDGAVADVVTEVTWSAANAASGIKPGDFQKFEIIVGSLPDSADTITFPAIQTYSDGTVVRWIQTQTPGGPAADKPAPVLTLTKPGATATPTTPTTAGSSGTAAIVSPSTSDNSARALGIVGIVLGAIALVAATGALMRRRRAG